MTVTGDPSAVPDGDLDHAEVFAVQYQTNWERLRRHIVFRLDVRHAHLAEDMAQEVFLKLWKNYVLPGKLQAPDRVYPLLKLMARSVIGAFYDTKYSRDRSLDFADPVNTRIVATGHAYAVDTPALAALAAELDAAMDHMTACSNSWRALHKERYTLRGHLAEDYLAYRGGLTEDAKARTAACLAEADREEETALDTFRNACHRVGELRAEIEAEAGVNWRSASGMPASADITPTLKGRYRNDLSVAHCPEGHQLDKDNVHFDADGSRSCRACKAAQMKETTLKRRGATGRPKRDTVSAEAIATARQMRADPDHAHKTLADIAASIGCSAATLIRRIPDHRDLRRAARDAAAAVPAGAAR